MKTLLIIIIVVLVLVVGGAAYYGYQWYKAVPSSEVAQTVTIFLQHLSDKNFNAAYQMTAQGLKLEASEEEFGKSMAQIFDQRAIQSHRKTGFSYRMESVKVAEPDTFKKTYTYEYDGTITFTDEGEGEFFVVLIEEGGSWKVHEVDITVY